MTILVYVFFFSSSLKCETTRVSHVVYLFLIETPMK